MSVIEEKLKNIFKDLLKVDPENIQTCSYFDNSNWDSMNHLSLIIEIEKVFNIKFTNNQIIDMTSYEEILTFLKNSSDIK